MGKAGGTDKEGQAFNERGRGLKDNESNGLVQEGDETPG